MKNQFYYNFLQWSQLPNVKPSWWLGQVFCSDHVNAMGSDGFVSATGAGSAEKPSDVTPGHPNEGIWAIGPGTEVLLVLRR